MAPGNPKRPLGRRPAAPAPAPRGSPPNARRGAAPAERLAAEDTDDELEDDELEGEEEEAAEESDEESEEDEGQAAPAPVRASGGAGANGSDEDGSEEAEAEDDAGGGEEAGSEADAEAEAFAEGLGDEEAPAGEEKPALLRAIEKILADPEQIKLDVEKLRVRYRREYKGRQLSHVVAEKLVDHYGRRNMLVGGATALAGVIPGFGTVVGLFGSAIADAALSMKYEIEMVQAIAFAYGRDITTDEEQKACLLVAGVGTLAEVGKFTGKRLTTDAFVKLVNKLLAGNVAKFLFLVFKLLGLKLGPKAILQAIPFGVGLSLNVLANRTVTRLVGGRAIAYFEAA